MAYLHKVASITPGVWCADSPSGIVAAVAMELDLPEIDDATTSERQANAVGILLINLGTPDAPSFWAVRSYLAEFLSDPLVIDLPRLPWLLLLQVAILNIRPFRTAAAYRKVWRDDGSPLLVNTNSISRGLEQALNEKTGRRVLVETGMRYGSPSLADGIEKLAERGADRLLLLPLYPQFSHTTTTTSFRLADEIVSMLPEIRETKRIEDYHDSDDYAESLAASVREHWDSNGRGEHLVLSFHGLPQRYIENGDPYLSHCEKTAALLVEKLALRDDVWTLCYQSRVGREAWLRPYAVDVIDELAGHGYKTVDVICPGFPADCLETLEEVEMGYGERFSEYGGVLRYIPALNDDPKQIALLCQLAMDSAGSWLSSSDL